VAIAEKKESFVIWDKIFDELSAFVPRLDDSVTTEFADFRTFALWTILRRFLRKKRQEN